MHLAADPETTAEATDTTPDVPAEPGNTTGTRDRMWRTVALLLGLFSAVCAIAMPFLPVVQDTARIVWPNGTDTRPVNAPLTGYWAQDMRVDLPCRTVRSLDARSTAPALLYSTVPEARADNGAGMQVRVDDGLLLVSSRGQQIARQPLPVQPGTDCDIGIRSTATRTTITVGGQPVYDQAGDVRPRIVGIYTDLTANRDPVDGLGVSITTDTRYQSTPTGWKVAVGALAVLSLIGCLVAVNRRDSRVARRSRRWAPPGWWRPTPRDVTVFAALGAWVFIGPGTSDDGYILSMARVAEDAGFLANYHRWFGVAEAPFGWFYHVYELMTHVSTVPPWIRLPSFLMGLLSWLLISREVMPRLGSQVRTSRAAGWAAAAVFLVWWMPFNNGVRPEPVAAVGSLLAICAVERCLVTRRLLPLCLGLLAAALTLAATPTGLLAVAPFLVAARPLFQLLRARARTMGWLPVLAPILAAGVLVLVVIFADQTFATVTEATRIRTQVGPSMSWFEELARYELLFDDSADGSAVRRFPVLLLILCTGTCLVVLLRRGRIPGAALGPSRRLIGTVALFFVLLALTPTKWTHHFGAFAAVGAAMAALTALATSSTVLRSRRNRAGFLAGLLVVASLAATGPNSYWFVSNLGVPFSGEAPSFGGITLSTILLVAAAIAGVVAFVENVRAHRPDVPAGPQERPRRSLRLGSLSLVVVCGLVAVAEFASMAVAIGNQRGSYSVGAANVAHLFGHSCNLSDQVQVERDPVASVLTPAPAADQRTVAETTPEESGLPSPDQGNGPSQTGFHTNAGDTKDPLNKPPHGFTSASVPMWSSYQDPENPVGRLYTDWYALPQERADKQVVITSASAPGKGVTVGVQYGMRTAAGTRVLRDQAVLGAGLGNGSWNDVRFDLSSLPQGATSVRVVALDDDLTPEGWVAVAAPRVPSYTSLTQRIGDRPVYMDWPTSFVYPCLRPVTVHDGIGQLPAYRITAASLANEGNWAESPSGGPIGWLEEVADEPEVPSSLAGEPGQPWGELRQIEPYTTGAQPLVIHGEETHFGWWTPGPGPQQPNGMTPTR